MIAEVIRMREEQNKKTSQKVVKMLRKRWVVPAIYLASAAIILTGALWYQFSNPVKPIDQPTKVVNTNDPESVPVSKSVEKLAYPVSKDTTVEVKSHFYDDSASAAQQQQSLIVEDSKYTLNTGVDLAKKDGKSFNVTATLSGTVTKAEKDSELGYVVTVDSGKGLVSYYESLQSVSVEAGDHVKQDQVIGVAGTALIGKENGTHVHYELRKDGTAINPEKYFSQEVSVILNSEKNDTNAANGSDASEKKPAKKEEDKVDNRKDKGEGDSADYQG
jgi:stage II sporulation protein Q